MNAVVDIDRDTVVAPPAEHRIPGRDRSWIDALLQRWGAWIWKYRAFEGYPTTDSIAAFLYGAGGRTNQHRILCKDPPPWFTLTHILVIMLPEHEGVAVFTEYVPGVDDDGRIMSRADRCAKINVNEETFRKQLQRAKVRIWEWSRVRKR